MAASSVVDGNGGSGGGELVVTELLGHIKELVTQLGVHLGGSSPELCRHLVSQILSITERSVSLLITTSSSNLGGGAGKRSTVVASPVSDYTSDAPFVKATKKRKTTDKKRHDVRVSSASDHPADDGHSWRKYGHKKIVGAKHPRGYYRCTHRHSQGCAATKQVQRTNEDPTFFDVVYLGDHTCVQRATAAAAGQAAADMPAPEYKHNDNPGASSSLLALQSLTVKTEGPAVEPEQQLPVPGWDDAPTLFSFSSTPATATGRSLVAERSPFSAPSTSDNWGVSPATSNSNHVVPLPPFVVAARDVQFGFEEVVISAMDMDRADGDGFVVDELDIDVSRFLV